MTTIRRALAAALLVGAAASAVLSGPSARAATPLPSGAAQHTATAPRGLVVRLLDEPTALKNDPRAAAYIIDQMKPGASITRHIQVTNDTGGPTTASLYASAATIADGGFDIGVGSTPNELTGWTTVTPSSMPLADGASGVVTVTISVPSNATNGERYEGLVAALPVGKGAGGVSVENRVAIRTYLSVSGGSDPVPAPNFSISQLQAERLSDGTPEVAATITNTGGRALDLSGVLKLTGGPGGLSAGPFATDGTSTLGVGQSGQIYVKLDKSIPAGPWTARIDATSDTITRSATGVITFPSAAGSKASPVKAKPVPIAKNRSVVGAVAGVLIGVVIIGILLFAWKRRRRDEDDETVAESQERASV